MGEVETIKSADAPTPGASQKNTTNGGTTTTTPPAAAPAQPVQQTTNYNPFGAAPAKKQAGTGFTNISKIVQANQGNKLGSAISSGVQGAATTAQNNVQQAGQQFQQQSQANRLDSADNTARVQQIMADPTKATDADVAAFAQYRSGQYAGPTGLANQDQLQNQVTQAQSLGQAAGSAGGRQALLQRFAGGPSYTAGQQRMDNVLLGSTGQQQISQAARAANGLASNFQQQQDAAGAQASELQNRAKAFGEDVTGQLKSAYDPASQALDSQVKAANDAEVKRQSDLNAFRSIAGEQSSDFQSGYNGDKATIDNALSSGLISKEQADKLNSLNTNTQHTEHLDGFQDSQAYDKQRILRDQLLNNLKTTDASAPAATRGNLADNQTRAQLNALQRLSGNTTEFDPAAEAYKAGTASINTDNITNKTVICTELATQGFFTPELLELDEAYGLYVRNTRPEVYEGYMAWAPYVVKAMQKSKLVSRIVKTIATPWAAYMAHEMEPEMPKSIAGAIINTIGEKFGTALLMFKKYEPIKN